MNPLMMSLSNISQTANGAMSYASTGSHALDMFSKVGSMRNATDEELVEKFASVLEVNPDLAIRMALWVRDCRGGAGERSTGRKLFKLIDQICDADVAELLIKKIVELGRWDDILVMENHFGLVMLHIMMGLVDSNQSDLVRKWLPRQKSAQKDLANKIIKGMSVTPKEYRQICSSVTTTETLMCSKQWDKIKLSSVPSVASTRYQKAFERNHPGYSDWKAQLASGEAKVNASVSFPHDVWRMIKAEGDKVVAQATWDALPNYIPVGVSLIPIVDTSGSMGCSASGSLSCLDVSISLGSYIASKNTGPFANAMITFNTTPEFHVMGDGNIADEMNRVAHIPWGGSTNFQATFDLILNRAVVDKIAQEDMPDYLICLSDMQFDDADGKYGNYQSPLGSGKTNFEVIKAKFDHAGYKMPKLIFWNLNGQYADQPARASDENVMMVSGFSPAILQATLSGNSVNPEELMMEVLMNERYNILA